MWFSKISINVEDMLVKKKNKSCLGKVCHKLKRSSFEEFFFLCLECVGGTKGTVVGGWGTGGVGTDWESHFQTQASLTGLDLGTQRWAWAWLPFPSYKVLGILTGRL